MLHTLRNRFFDEEADTSEQGVHEYAGPSLAAAASIVALGFLASRLLGLLRSVVIAHQFGTSASLDAFWVAFRVPDLIFQLIAGATLGAAFIPTFAKTFAKVGEADAWKMTSSVLNLVFAATLVVAVAGLLLAPVLVPVTAPGLGDETGQSQELTSLAVDLTRIAMMSCPCAVARIAPADRGAAKRSILVGREGTPRRALERDPGHSSVGRALEGIQEVRARLSLGSTSLRLITMNNFCAISQLIIPWIAGAARHAGHRRDFFPSVNCFTAMRHRRWHWSCVQAVRSQPPSDARTHGQPSAHRG
jgi:hypothetical protein